MTVSLIPLRGKTPDIDKAAFVAPGCRLMGDVVMGEDSSLWYNCVVRADVNFIRIGARTNIQDGTVVHCDSAKGDYPGFPTLIGDDVLIGHQAMIHGCVLQDRAFVGLGAIVMDGCVIESGGMLAAGALLPPGRRIAAGEMWVGRPAKFARMLTSEEMAGHQAGVQGYVQNARAHARAVALL